MSTALHPDLLAALSAVDRGDVCSVRGTLGQPRVWLLDGRNVTPVIDRLLDAGLAVKSLEYLRPLAVTGKGRELLASQPIETAANLLRRAALAAASDHDNDHAAWWTQCAARIDADAAAEFWPYIQRDIAHARSFLENRALLNTLNPNPES